MVEELSKDETWAKFVEVGGELGIKGEYYEV